MNRRQILLGLAAATLSRPPEVRGQRSTIETVGFLHAGPPDRSTDLANAFQTGLSQAGYVPDQNIAIEYRWANGQDDRLPGLARELAQRRVRVIAVGGNTAARLAAKAATATTPIVFVTARDPLDEGLVASMNRPGANVTGVTILSTALDTKRMELLHEMVPDADPITILANPKDQRTEAQLSELRRSAITLGKRIQIINATDEHEIDLAFAKASQLRARALLVMADVIFSRQRDRIVGLAARYAIPAIYEWREFTEAGGLMSYGTSITEGYRQMGLYVAKILQGARPADLPVMQSAKFEFVINTKTAATLGIKVPQAFFLRADELIR